MKWYQRDHRLEGIADSIARHLRDEGWRKVDGGKRWLRRQSSGEWVVDSTGPHIPRACLDEAARLDLPELAAVLRSQLGWRKVGGFLRNNPRLLVDTREARHLLKQSEPLKLAREWFEKSQEGDLFRQLKRKFKLSEGQAIDVAGKALDAVIEKEKARLTR